VIHALAVGELVRTRCMYNADPCNGVGPGNSRSPLHHDARARDLSAEEHNGVDLKYLGLRL
jgi:hypothetical protein